MGDSICGSRAAKINGYNGDKVALELYDISGRKIIDRLNYNYQSGGIIQLSAGHALRAGIYLLRVTGDNVDKVFKLIAR